MPRAELARTTREPGAITSFADVFRYELLHRHGGWWVDTDVYCLTDELPKGERVWAEQEPGLLNNAILKFLPATRSAPARLARA
jgi:mannosyltransferase OCH1-like enzyme